MNRKQFIESQGATCSNWNWSWSFINQRERTIIFGVWDQFQSGNRSLILSADWQVSRRGKKQAGYAQSREHIRLIEEDGYQLRTFPMIYSAEKEAGGIGPAKIKGFTPKLSSKTLIRIGSGWYACDDETPMTLAEELASIEAMVEGASHQVCINAFERNAAARARCLEHHGYTCKVCSFNFQERYGAIGRKYIHVHHLIPLSEIRTRYEVDPIRDLVPVCPNCHAMIHSTRPALHLDQLRGHLRERAKKR